MPQNLPQDVLAELAPTGVLRAGINLSNFLLVSGKSATGEPEGVAPDMARAIAERLGVAGRLRHLLHARASSPTRPEETSGTSA